MINALLFVILLACIATLIVGIRTLQSSRRSEGMGEDRYELLRDQYERLELLREERRGLIEELEGESRERRRLLAHLEGGRTQSMDDLGTERQGRVENARVMERHEQERLRLEQQLKQLREELEREHRTHLEAQQRTEQLEREHQRLTVDLEKERHERSEVQQWGEQQEEERALLEQELQGINAGFDSQTPSRIGPQKWERDRPWWRRGILLGGLVIGVLVVWLTSLMVALSILSP